MRRWKVFILYQKRSAPSFQSLFLMSHIPLIEKSFLLKVLGFITPPNTHTLLSDNAISQNTESQNIEFSVLWLNCLIYALISFLYDHSVSHSLIHSTIRLNNSTSTIALYTKALMEISIVVFLFFVIPLTVLIVGIVPKLAQTHHWRNWKVIWKNSHTSKAYQKSVMMQMTSKLIIMFIPKKNLNYSFDLSNFHLHLVYFCSWKNKDLIRGDSISWYHWMKKFYRNILFKKV